MFVSKLRSACAIWNFCEKKTCNTKCICVRDIKTKTISILFSCTNDACHRPQALQPVIQNLTTSLFSTTSFEQQNSNFFDSKTKQSLLFSKQLQFQFKFRHENYSYRLYAGHAQHRNLAVSRGAARRHGGFFCFEKSKNFANANKNMFCFKFFWFCCLKN